MSVYTFYLDILSRYEGTCLKLYEMLYTDLENYSRNLRIQLEPPPFYI